LDFKEDNMFSGKKKCLSEFEIGAYIDGNLPEEKRDDIEKHFADCNKCWDEFVEIQRVITLKSGLDPEEVPAGMLRKVVNMFPEKTSIFDVVLQFVQDAVEVVQSSADFSLLTPVPVAGFRGSEDAAPKMVVLKRSFEEINVELDVEKISDDMCSIRIAVDELASKGLADTLRVDLLSNGRELYSALFENGEALLEDMSTGSYSIKIHKQGKTYGEIALKIQ